MNRLFFPTLVTALLVEMCSGIFVNFKKGINALTALNEAAKQS
jgi:hypothetical protein